MNSVYVLRKAWIILIFQHHDREKILLVLGLKLFGDFSLQPQQKIAFKSPRPKKKYSSLLNKFYLRVGSLII